MSANECLLGIKPSKYEKCPSAAECANCGWRSDNAEERHRRIKEEGLQTGEDGLRRLIIKKKGGTENER